MSDIAAADSLRRNIRKALFISVAVAVSVYAISTAHSQFVVAAPGVEVRQDYKNAFDALKYVWEQAQWADKLATLHSTLTTVREHLETANLVKHPSVTLSRRLP
jgi:hypothetical protein